MTLLSRRPQRRSPAASRPCRLGAPSPPPAISNTRTPAWAPVGSGAQKQCQVYLSPLGQRQMPETGKQKNWKLMATTPPKASGNTFPKEAKSSSSAKQGRLPGVPGTCCSFGCVAQGIVHLYTQSWSGFLLSHGEQNISLI